MGLIFKYNLLTREIQL